MTLTKSRVTRFGGLFLCVLVAILIGRSAARNIYVTSRDSRGWTRLHVAAYQGNLPAVEALIEKGAGVFATTSREGYTPLHLAAMQGHVSIVRLLTSERILRHALGRPVRARSGHLKEIPRDFGFVVTARDAESAHLQDMQGRTPLHYAVINKHKPVCEVLLSNRTLLFWRMGEVYDRNHLLPTDYAVRNDDRTTVEYLVGKGIRADYDLLLREAVRYSSPEMLELLISLGADPNPHNGTRDLPLLHEAVITGRPEMAAVLLRHRVDVDTTDATGRSPLRLAVARGATPIARILLRAGARVDLADAAGITPLRAAVLMRHQEPTNLLISGGASVRACDSRKWTLLHSAAQDGNADLCDALASRGADVNAATYDGRTPLHLAAFGNDRSVVDVLIRRGADLDSRDYMGQTPLHYAAYCGAVEVARLLIAYGTDVQARDLNKQSAADCADLADEAGVLGLLEAHGARARQGPMRFVESPRPRVSPSMDAVIGPQPQYGRSGKWRCGLGERSDLRNAVLDGDVGRARKLLGEFPTRAQITNAQVESALSDAGRIGRSDMFEMLADCLALRRKLEVAHP